MTKVYRKGKRTVEKWWIQGDSPLLHTCICVGHKPKHAGQGLLRYLFNLTQNVFIECGYAKHYGSCRENFSGLGQASTMSLPTESRKYRIGDQTIFPSAPYSWCTCAPLAPILGIIPWKTVPPAIFGHCKVRCRELTDQCVIHSAPTSFQRGSKGNSAGHWTFKFSITRASQHVGYILVTDLCRYWFPQPFCWLSSLSSRGSVCGKDTSSCKQPHLSNLNVWYNIIIF